MNLGVPTAADSPAQSQAMPWVRAVPRPEAASQIPFARWAELGADRPELEQQLPLGQYYPRPEAQSQIGVPGPRPEFGSQVATPPFVPSPAAATQVPAEAEAETIPWRIPEILTKEDSLGTPEVLASHNYKLSRPELARLRLDDPDTEESVTGSPTVVPLTWEAYDKLNKAQRLGVDFNTLLVEARTADLTHAGAYSDEEMKLYNESVGTIFGSAGGSDKVAMNVVNLLKSINFTAVGQDLDEYLSLDRGFTLEELGPLTLSRGDALALKQFDNRDAGTSTQEKQVVDIVGQKEGVDAGEAYTAVRTPLNMMALDTRILNDALNAYKSRTVDWSNNPWSIQSALGIPDKDAKLPIGYRQAEQGSYEYRVDDAVKRAYESLKVSPDQKTLDWLYDLFKTNDWHPDEIQGLWDYANNRSAREVQYMDDKGAQSVRDLLGWK